MGRTDAANAQRAEVNGADAEWRACIKRGGGHDLRAQRRVLSQRVNLRRLCAYQSLPKTSPPRGVTADQNVASEMDEATVRTLPSAKATSIPPEYPVWGMR